MTDDFPELVPATGHLPTTGRGSMPFALLHGEALVAVAAWAAGEAGVELLDFDATWAQVQETGRPLVLHDPLCPMTPPGFLTECARTAVARDQVVVAVRPVTDTVKQVDDGRLGQTVDRDGLVTVCSPVVLPPSVVAALAGRPGTDFVELVTSLRSSYDVLLVDAPPTARRVASDEDIRALEALTDGR